MPNSQPYGFIQPPKGEIQIVEKFEAPLILIEGSQKKKVDEIDLDEHNTSIRETKQLKLE